MAYHSETHRVPRSSREAVPVLYRMQPKTSDLRIVVTRPLIAPQVLEEELSLSETAAQTVIRARSEISEIIHGRSQKVLAIVGPCSIHDPAAALDYAAKLKQIAHPFEDRLVVVMRAYFEKPRTTVGWKGFINDPDLDDSYHINKGLRAARELLLSINEVGIPTGSEFLDLQVPQFIADLTSWAAIGARTAESQVHRELASGLSMPVGFKNGTEGNVTLAIDGVQSARASHWFPSVTKEGVAAISQTAGNPDCHVILRGGGRPGPNFSAEHVERAAAALAKRGLPARVMIDCSHGNSGKDHTRQRLVAEDVAAQIRQGSDLILGVMIESNLVSGRQDYTGRESLVYGQSITDSCVDLAETEDLLRVLAEAR